MLISYVEVDLDVSASMLLLFIKRPLVMLSLFLVWFDFVDFQCSVISECQFAALFLFTPSSDA